MAPSRPSRDIKLTVPRFNSKKVGPKLAKEITSVAKREKVKIDVKQTVDPTTALALAISASEWNSLLMTARADRGPQWDIGTQMFMVDKGSDLYYNPTPLTGKESRHESSDKGIEPPNRLGQQLGQMHGQMQSPNMPQHHPGMMGGFPGGSPYGVQQQVPPDQFYGGSSPMHLRPPQMGSVPQDHTMSPDIRRRVTRAMSDEYQMHGM
ncbi:hypothetical protein BDM02DRAFT_2073680 [Thelephora ganbajun]|uniref:Uncharacterized protein n=1 Tax=Thelephora ganbajun TaxID=370292 RepID=A0ACB6ZGP7_THEGA|nr:hypothetical protein BDM02DRAFT_2073680 [Thelephora ganbajun]